MRKVTVNTVVKEVNSYINNLYAQRMVKEPLSASDVLRLIEQYCGCEGQDKFRVYRTGIILKNTDLVFRVKYRVFSGTYGHRKLTAIGCYLVDDKWGRYYISNVV